MASIFVLTPRYCDTRGVSTSTDPNVRGPWPEPDEPAHPVAAWDERDGPQGSEPQGSKGVSIAVAALSVAYLLMLPVLLVVGIYTFITVYAIVKAVDAGPDTADAGVVLIGTVGLVTFFVLLLGGGLWAIGRAADPKKRQRY